MKSLILWLALITLPQCSKVGSRTEPLGPTNFQWEMMAKDNAPEARKQHSAVWTGTEWIVWGGLLIPNPEETNRKMYADGSVFNSVTKTWSPLNLNGAPESRFGHSAVWTGEEMIIWGGARALTIKTGGRYKPNTGTWTAISTPTDLTDRYFHRAVWTGEKMFLWGGLNLQVGTLASGAEYDPKTDQWEMLTETNAPSARQAHTLNLAGRKIYIWGGMSSNEPDSARGDGAIYDLVKKEWASIPSTNLIEPRGFHSAVYGRKKLMVWGGLGKRKDGSPGAFNSGAIYDIQKGTWKAMSTAGAPRERHGHVAVWTGKKMLIWGGMSGSAVLSNGALYDPETDTWENLISPPKGFTSRYGATGVWTGEALFVWGGASSIRANPAELDDGAILAFPASELGD